MRLLLDTHILVWIVQNDQKLTAADRVLLAQPNAQFLISSTTIWELRIKWNGRRATSRDGLLDPFEAIEFAERHRFELAALTASDCAASLETPLGHRDPFDEMLLIHAQRLDAKLLTHDRDLLGHPLVYRFG